MSNQIYVPIDAEGFADRENLTIIEPEGDWRPYDGSFNGLYKPKYDDENERWIEGATQEEINEMNPSPEPPKPTLEDYLIDLDFRLSLVELGLI